MTLSLDLSELDPRDRYKLLTAVILPRPVAWVTTMGRNGVVNAAPFSFFNLFGQDPALVVLGLEHRADGTIKDTTRNIRQTGEFVVNIVTETLAREMVGTAAAYPPEAGEPEALGLKLAPSIRMATPRLADVPAAVECRLYDLRQYSDERDIVVGEAIGLATRDGLVDTSNYHVDWQGDFPLARLFADKYARLEEIAPMSIPAAPTDKGAS